MGVAGLQFGVQVVVGFAGGCAPSLQVQLRSPITPSRPALWQAYSASVDEALPSVGRLQPTPKQQPTVAGS